MILADTSVWVRHFREGNVLLESLLNRGAILAHPFVIGELACGNLTDRQEIIGLLQSLPQAVAAGHDEVMRFLELHRLMGIGLGYIDMHLLASALLTPAPLWTFDRKLRKTAERLSVGFRST